MLTSIVPDDALILPHRANPAGSNFRERQVYGWIDLFAAERMAILLVDHNVRRGDPHVALCVCA